MAQKSDAQLGTDLAANFGDGGAATAAEYRAFQTDVIDSKVNNDQLASASGGTAGQRWVFNGTDDVLETIEAPVSINHTGAAQILHVELPPWAGEIVAARHFTDTGTVDVTVRIGVGGTVVTGLSAISSSSTDTVTNATALNAFTARAIAEIEIANPASSPTRGLVALRVRRTGL